MKTHQAFEQHVLGVDFQMKCILWKALLIFELQYLAIEMNAVSR